MKTRFLPLLLLFYCLMPLVCHADATSAVQTQRRIPHESAYAGNATHLFPGQIGLADDAPGHLWVGTLTGNVLANIQGQNGVMGTPGTVWYNSAGAPSAGTGINGDYNLDTQTGNVYTKTAGAWGLIENIKGTNGTNGSPGVKGDTGSPGTAATIAVGTVTQGAVGTAPIITNTGTSSAAAFAFTLPAPGVGAKGDTGATGPNYPIKAGATTLTSAPSSLSFGSGLSATAAGNDVLVTSNYTYTLPAATASSLGGVSVPASGGLTVSGGALSETQPILSIGAGLGLTGGALIDTMAASSQAANTVYAGPVSGSAGAMGVRGLVSADLPAQAQFGSSSVAGSVSVPYNASNNGQYVLYATANYGRRFGLYIQPNGNSGGFQSDSLLTVEAGSGVNIGNTSAPVIIDKDGAGNSTLYNPSGNPLALGSSDRVVYTPAHLLVGSVIEPTGYALNTGPMVQVQPNTPSEPGMSVQNASGQTANGYQLLSPTSAVLWSVAPNGTVITPAALTAIAAKSSAYTLTTTDTTLLVTGTTTITLPAVSASLAGHSWTVKNTGTGTVTLSGTIDSAANPTLAAQYQYITFCTDGTSYFKVGGN